MGVARRPEDPSPKLGATSHEVSIILMTRLARDPMKMSLRGAAQELIALLLKWQQDPFGFPVAIDTEVLVGGGP